MVICHDDDTADNTKRVDYTAAAGDIRCQSAACSDAEGCSQAKLPTSTAATCCVFLRRRRPQHRRQLVHPERRTKWINQPNMLELLRAPSGSLWLRASMRRALSTCCPWCPLGNKSSRAFLSRARLATAIAMRSSSRGRCGVSPFSHFSPFSGLRFAQRRPVRAQRRAAWWQASTIALAALLRLARRSNREPHAD